MTTGVVVFDPVAFVAQYPAFTAPVTSANLTQAFALATTYVDNSVNSRIGAIEDRQPLLYLLTAHITQLLFGINGQAPTGLVGRVSDAAEGSVSVGTDLGDLPFSAQWFAQTQFGLMFWQFTGVYRRMRYFPGRSGPAPAPDFRLNWPAPGGAPYGGG